MGGFTGICSSDLKASTVAVEQAVAATVYSAKASSKSLLNDARFNLSKSSFNFLENSTLSARYGDVHVWVDGEIFNERSWNNERNSSFAQALLQAYHENSIDQLLPQVDGVYIAILYDAAKQLLHIITDRYGLKPFYFYHNHHSLIMASELKCFPYFEQFNLEIRKDVIACFMQLEHFMGNTTWFKDVFITEPSAIYSYSIPENHLSFKRYWSWSEIKESTLSLADAAEEMAVRLDVANKARYVGDCKIGVALSGGLDSRAILAAVEEYKPVTYTFGVKNSDDVQIAKRVAAMAGVKHVHYDTYADNWLISRFKGIWKTDGMLNMGHMHYAHLMEEVPKIMDINLSGFLGDAVIGGTYLKKKKVYFKDKRIDEAIARHYYGEHYALSDPYNSFFDLNKVDPYLFYNRGRRMIGLGAEEANKTIAQRLPFMDIRLMDLSFSLPDSFRADSKVYTMALLLKYPQFFKTIPHATTGVPIENTPTLTNRFWKTYYKGAHAVREKLGLRTSFADVNNWIKEPGTALQIKEILNPKQALYPNFVNADYVQLYVDPHLQGKQNFTRQIMGALTMEVWFQQVFNKKYN